MLAGILISVSLKMERVLWWSAYIMSSIWILSVVDKATKEQVIKFEYKVNVIIDIG